jgi:hypothetical protein
MPLFFQMDPSGPVIIIHINDMFRHALNLYKRNPLGKVFNRDL